MIDIIPLAKTPMLHRLRRASMAAFAFALTCGALNAAPSPIGTGLKSNITLGALNTPLTEEQKAWPWTVNYDVDLSTWRYDVYVPPHYDGTKPFGVVVYTSSDNIGVVLSAAATDRDVIWIAPRNVGNNAADQTNRFGASLLAFHRAKEMFNIDPRRLYISGKSGGGRVASALAFLHSEIIRGTCPSVGFCLPRFDEVTPNYIPETSVNTDSYYNYSIAWLFGEDLNSINANAISRNLRSYLITGEDDHREEYFVEAYHCAYEPQGLTTFLYDGPRGHVDASDAEMRDAIDYLDRDDTFPIDAKRDNSFAGLTNISQSGATLSTPTIGSGQNAFAVKRLTPTATAVAAVKSDNAVYWDNRNGSTFRWLWEVSAASPQNQKTNFGVWFANETWGGGPPNSLTAGTNPGILITITQTAAGNRMIISARPDSGGETVFYNGLFSFVPAYSTAQTKSQTGYLSGTGSPVEIRLEVNEKRFQLNFNGIKLDGATTTVANGVRISRDTRRAITGYWDTALGTAFWKHDPFTSWVNTWSPFTKSIFTASTGAVDSAGATPAPMDLRYVLVSDPGLPDPPQPGPTGLAASSSNDVVNLTWNAVDGATSYTLLRSAVSGGPYTTIQSGIAGTSFTDSNVTAGNIYYYTIFATTPSGDTATVPELAAGAGFQVVTWTGGGTDNNWQSAANWNTSPVAGDTLTFAGSTRLSNTNNYPANTSFRDLIFSSGAGAFTLAGNTVALTGNVANNSASTQTVNLPVTLASGSHDVATSSGAVTLGGAISGSGSLSKSGTGTAALTAANSHSGGVTISGGTLGFARANGANTNLGTGAVTVNAGAILRAGYNVTSNQNISTTANAVTLAGGSIYADDANQHLSGAVNVSTSGTLGSTYNAGINSAAERDKGLALDGVVSGTGSLTVQHTRITSGNNYHTSFVSFSNNANSYSGTLTVNENTTANEGGVYVGVNGTTALQNASIVTSPVLGTNLRFGSSPIVFKTGLGSATIGAIGGSGPLVLTGYDQINHAYGSDAIALTVGGNNATTTYSGVVSDAGSLTKVGSGILGLTGASTYSGGTTINSGTLGFANANGANTNLGSGSVTVNAGAILRPGYTVTSNQNISTTANNITLAGGSIYADDANQHLSGAINVSTSGTLGSTYNAGNNSAAEKDKGLALDGVVSGSGALTVQHTRLTSGNNYHTSFVSFSNNTNSYSGTLTINENTTASEGGVYLGVNGSTALQNASIVTSPIPGGNLRFGSSPIVFKTGLGSATIGAISGSGPLVLTGYDQVNHAFGTDAIALTVGSNHATTSYSAAISGLGGLVKAGTGMMTLSGTSTYSGATTINGGTLNLTGALNSNAATVTINTGGTLAGTGTVARATTLESGGAISPGNGGSSAAGTLTLSGGLTLNTGAVLNLDLVGTTTSDKLAVSGAFAANGTTTINLTTLAGFAGSGSYTIVTGATGISAGNFTVGSVPSGYVCTLSVNGSALNVIAMTEVESWREANFGTTTNSGNAADSADPDSDGMTNASEYTAGTDPQNPASALRVSAIATDANDVSVSFPSVAGKTYRLERSETLQDGSWSPVQENIAGTGGALQVIDSGGMAQTKRFYRLVAVP
jgi:autotransporter-associated beta strand protein